MARDGSGNFTLPEADFVAGTTIVAATMNSNLQDVSDALTASVAKDGQTTMTGALPMGSQRITGLGDATARTDAAKVSQIQDGSYVYGTTAGTANAQTLTPAPAITAYAAGQKFRAKIGAALTNTGATTLQVSGIASPKNIFTQAGDALVGGELQPGAIVDLVYDGTQFVLQSLYCKVGTYTPTLTLGGGSVSYTTQVGSYIRLGNLVWFQATIVINVATTPSGTVHLLLPFAVRNVTGTGSPILAQTVGTGAGTYGTSGRTVINTSTALINNLTGSPAAEGDLGAALTDGDTVYATGWYQTVA